MMAATSKSAGSKALEKLILGVVTIVCAMTIACFVVASRTYDKVGTSTPAASSSSGHAGESHHWTWSGSTGPNYWGTLNDGDADCLGTYEQSPIDIPARLAGYPLTTTTATAQKVKGLTTAGSMSTGNKFTVSQSHGAPKYSCSGAAGSCGYITHNSKQYNLLQLHFHTPSEHTIDGKHYPLCAHLVHLASDNSVSVLGIMFDQTASASSTSAPVQLLNKLFNYMAESSAEVSSATDVYDFVSANSGYYNYPGSFTTPPCTEGVNWIVQSEIIPVTKAQVDYFWGHIGGYPGNSRPTMPLNSRSITYNVPANEHPGEWAWTPYDAYGLPVGPASWTDLGYSDCAGTSQSPIDFPITASSNPNTGQTANVLLSATPATPSTDILVPSPAKFRITQSHGAPKFTCKVAGTCGTLSIPGSLSATGDTAFELLQVHFHSPSEHTIDGKIYPLCAHMVHVNAAGTAYAVVGVLFDTTEAEATSNTLTNFIDTLFGTSTVSTGYLASDNVDSSQNLDFQSTLISTTSGFYNYPGSFTTPPCTEVVTWIVQAEVQKVKVSQVELFYNHIGGFPGNFRPPQPLGSRTINYQVA